MTHIDNFREFLKNYHKTLLSLCHRETSCRIDFKVVHRGQTGNEHENGLSMDPNGLDKPTEGPESIIIPQYP